MLNLCGKSVVITGGTGSFGSSFLKYLIDTNNIPYQAIVYSRDWNKQKELRDSLHDPNWIKWVIGDVRDKDRLYYIPSNIDFVIHAAAIKCIEACEKNAEECLKTNIIGTQNIIDVCIERGVRKAILISTDKAVLPINTYGTSKKMAEKLWIAARNRGLTKFNVCRYGNVIGSSGSVLPLYKKLIANGRDSLPITDERMTRFWYSMNNAIEFVLRSLADGRSGEVFIPKIPSIRITDLCKALNMPYHVVGIREGEKLHECMIPPDPIRGNLGYDSFNNDRYLSVEEIREGIK